MKRTLLIIGAILLGFSVRAQSVTYTCRYWFDKDIAQAVTTTFSGSNWQAELDVGALSDGLHTLHLHAMDTSMRWSAPENFLFLKVSNIPAEQMTYYYWFDRDLANKQSGSLGNGQLFLDVDDLEAGLHTLHLMLNGTENSAVQNFLFLKVDAMGPDGGSYTYHCWFDRDLANQQTDTIGTGHILLDVEGLTEGIHTVNVMVEGTTHSATESYLFLKVPPVPSISQLAYHYWFDRDFDNRVTDSLGTGNILVDVNDLKDGLHTLHIILEGTDMAATESYMFVKIAVQEPEQELQYNCWFDEDYNTLLTGSVENGIFMVPVGMLTVGEHNMYMQVNDGTLSSPAVYPFYRDPMVTIVYDPEEGGTATGVLEEGICTLTAQPNQGYAFVNWTNVAGEVLSSAAIYSFELPEDAMIVAHFVRISYTITAVANPEEGGTVEGEGIYIEGTTCTLSAMPNVGYSFINWTKGNEVVSDEPTISFEATEDATYVANFELNTYEILAVANPEEGGSVDGSGTYTYGTTCTLTAAPNVGYSFINWTKGNEVVSDDLTISFSVTEDAEYLANFELNTYEILATANPEEGGTVEGSGTYNHGETCTLTAIPNEGYGFINWTKGNEVVSDDLTISFTVTESAEYLANFEVETYEISGNVSPHAGGTVEGFGYYAAGETCTLTAIPNEGYVFLYWMNFEGDIVSYDMEYSFTVTGDALYYASFELGMVEILAFAEPEEGGTVEGTGFYNVDETCTLTAIPNEGYAFLYWLLEGEIISTELSYSFTVTGSAEYVAYFEMTTPPVVGEGLMAYYPFNGNANDASGNGYHATACNDYQYEEGHTGQSIAVVGQGFSSSAGGHVLLPVYDFDILDGVTLSMWVKAEGLSSSDGEAYINFGNDIGADSDERMYILQNTSQVMFVYNTARITVPYESSYTGNWVMYTLSVSPDGLVAYVNGQKVGETEVEYTATWNTSLAALGRHWWNGGNTTSTRFTGSFDEVRIYNRPLTDAEVLTLYNDVNTYEILAVAEPEEGGTVEGAGLYAEGSTCTLTATPNEGYEFLYWLMNDEMISTEMEYSFEVFENAELTAVFESAIEIYYIEAFANPEEGGTVEGFGEYPAGETCILMAIPNDGYEFVNWTKDGVVVSMEPEYVFVVLEDGLYVANFVSSDTHWTVDPTLYPDNMSITGIIQIDGEEQFSETLELGAFCDGECRGTVMPVFLPNLERYFVYLTVYGLDGDVIEFRLFDHETNQEVDIDCESTLVFEMNAVIGDIIEPYVFNFVSAITQTTNFAAGWNWWSSYVELGDNGMELLENGLGSNGHTIKSQSDGYASYLEGFGWYGSLTSVNNESTYQIRANQACTIEITAAASHPSDYVLTLNHGWTWVGYPVSTSMSVADAFSGIVPQTGDMVKSQSNGYASYLDGFGWYGQLNTLTPGIGLMFKSNNATALTFSYPEGPVRNNLKANQTADNNYWRPNLTAYPDNMSVMAVVELDNVEVNSENYELAAFANGECRGSARLLYVEPLDRYFAFLTVAGDEATELYFGLYNTETGEEIVGADQTATFSVNAVLGSFAEPYVVSFRGTTGVDEWARSLQVYPNPVEPGLNITLGFDEVETGEVRVEIINAQGAVMEMRQATSLQTITAPNAAGVYTLRITVEGKGTCYRKLVVR